MPDPPDMRWVLHRHTPNDAPSHLDWMIGPWPGLQDNAHTDDRVLRSWRIQVDPTTAPRFAAEPAPDHRRDYLTIQHRELSDGRGNITRIAQGQATLLSCASTRIALSIQRDDAPHPSANPPHNPPPAILIATPDPHRPGWWLFQRADPNDQPPARDPAR